MEPLVSIIMGAYNESKVIDKAIKSILNQTYTNWELIICNDCSIDNTKEIVLEYCEKDKRIKIINNKKNLGLAASLNRCLKYASGEYIARQDADDISLPNRLEEQVNFLKQNSTYDLVASQVNLCDKNNNVWGQIKYKEIPTKYDLIKGVCFVHPTVMVRREMYDNLKGYSVWALRCEDYDLWFRMYENGYKGYNLPKVLFNYYVDQSDYKKRKYKYRIIESKVRFIGYNKLKLPHICMIYCLKPLIVGLVSNKLMYLFHKRKFKHGY